MAYVDRPVKILSISVNDTGPYFAPSYENVATAEYPLARNVYLNVNKKPGQPLNPVLVELYKFIWSYEGQSLVVSPRPIISKNRWLMRSARARYLLALPPSPS
jgi:phosphate transport system substrate-binding protein